MNNPMIVIVAMATGYMICVVRGEAGCGDLCVPYTQCPHLKELIDSPSGTKQQTDLLRKSFCGFQDNHTPKVCCTSAPTRERPAVVSHAAANDNLKCYTPDGLPGECVGAKSCARIRSMLSRRPWPQRIIDYVNKSRCVGPETFSVCCQQKDPIKDPCSIPSPILPNRGSGCCGASIPNSNRIAGGKTTDINQYPWIALLEYKLNNEITELYCAGSLISLRYVLTAGHCVKGVIVPVNVRLGEYNTANDGVDCYESDGGGQECTNGTTTIPIEKIIVHPEYTLRRHDIALIRMMGSAPYTDFVRPICLPSVDVTSLNPEEISFWVAGWGQVATNMPASAVKLHVQLPYKTLEQCQRWYYAPLTEAHLCAGGEKGKNACDGDSGGPLMYQNKKVFELVGVVSFGPIPCAQKNVPAVYTNVHEYYNWIASNIEP